MKLAALALLGLFICAGAVASDDRYPVEVASTDGLYKLVLTPNLSPLAINRLHTWALELRSPDDAPVLAATFAVTGGMPEHNHGLPTRPRVTRELGAGRYLLEGMRFHMPGRWEITIDIDAGAGRDSAIVRLQL